MPDNDDYALDDIEEERFTFKHKFLHHVTNVVEIFTHLPKSMKYATLTLYILTLCSWIFDFVVVFSTWMITEQGVTYQHYTLFQVILNGGPEVVAWGKCHTTICNLCRDATRASIGFAACAFVFLNLHLLFVYLHQFTTKKPAGNMNPFSVCFILSLIRGVCLTIALLAFFIRCMSEVMVAIEPFSDARLYPGPAFILCIINILFILTVILLIFYLKKRYLGVAKVKDMFKKKIISRDDIEMNRKISNAPLVKLKKGKAPEIIEKSRKLSIDRESMSVKGALSKLRSSEAGKGLNLEKQQPKKMRDTTPMKPPPPWVPLKSKKGEIYYYNEKTGIYE